MRMPEKLLPYFDSYRVNSRLYNKNWKDYRALYVWSTMLTVTILLTIVYSAAKQLLKAAGIPCLTTVTFKQLLQHPLCAAGFLVLAFLVYYACWFQYCVILMGMRAIRNDRYSLFGTMKEALNKTLHTSPLVISLFFVYNMLFLPAYGAMYPTDLLNYFTIPDYIIEFFLKHMITLVPFVILVVLVFWLTMKYYYVLPLSILKNVPFKDAFAESSKMMKGQKVSTLCHLLLMLLLFGLVELLFMMPLSLIQYLADRFFKDASIYVCLFTLTSLKIFSAFYLIRISTILFTTTYPADFFTEEATAESLDSKKQRKEKNRLFALASSIFTVITAFASAFVFLISFSESTPLVISYEGLDGTNGFPNSLEVLYKTVEAAHPDYVEIDVQETSDGQFAVVSTESFLDYYKKTDYAGSYTLAELTAMTGTFEQYTGSICSLDDYLYEAEKLDQKLILVLNEGSSHPEATVQNFLAQYGDRILKEEYPLETRDYAAVCEVLRINSEIKKADSTAPCYLIGYIVNVPFLYPDLEVDGLSVEKTNLRQSFVSESKQNEQNLHVWLVDDRDDIITMILMNVDGIITCYPSIVREEIKSITESGYLKVLWKYVLQLA